MSTHQTPQKSSPSGGKGPFVAVVGALALAGIVVAVIEARRKGDGTEPAQPSARTGEAPKPVSAFDAETRPPSTYAAFEGAPEGEVQELWWLEVYQPKMVHEVLRKNAWLDKAVKAPIGQGFGAAWSGFLGTRGEDIGKAFTGAIADMAFDAVLSQPYRVVWYGGGAAKGAAAIVIPTPSTAATAAFDSLVKVASSGGFHPPSCLSNASGAADGGAVPESIHRLVLAEKVVFAARLSDRLVVSTRPQAAMLAMCRPMSAMPEKPQVALSVGLSLVESGRGTQSVAAMLGIEDVVSLDFAVEGASLVPKGLMAVALAEARLASVAPSQDMLRAIPERSGVVLFLAVKLPKTLTAQALRDTLAPKAERFDGTRQSWPLETRHIAILWNPRGNRTNEVAVLWGTPSDEPAIAEAMQKGNGALSTGKACGVLAYASTKELMGDLQAACAGKKPSMLQAAGAVVKGWSQPSSVALTVNVGQVLSQLTFDGWFSEHPAPNVTTGPQEIEAARRLLEELPTLGFTATMSPDGKMVSGGFKS